MSYQLLTEDGTAPDHSYDCPGLSAFRGRQNHHPCSSLHDLSRVEMQQAEKAVRPGIGSCFDTAAKALLCQAQGVTRYNPRVLC